MKRREVPEGMKYCPYCERNLPVNEFYANRAQRDGKGGYCKECLPKTPWIKKSTEKQTKKHYLSGRLPPWMFS